VAAGAPIHSNRIVYNLAAREAAKAATAAGQPLKESRAAGAAAGKAALAAHKAAFR